MTNVAIIVGSHRENSQSLKIGEMLLGKLEQHAKCNKIELIELATANLPFWSEDYSEAEQHNIKGVKQRLVDANAYIVISPEWHGMVPAALKNLFLLYSSEVFAHKPALIASVSAGIGGTYPINEIRSTTYKNSRICYLPEHLIFRHVGQMFNGENDSENESQRYMSERSDYCLDYLMLYSEGLKQVRLNQPATDKFSNGM